MLTARSGTGSSNAAGTHTRARECNMQIAVSHTHRLKKAYVSSVSIKAALALMLNSRPSSLVWPSTL